MSPWWWIPIGIGILIGLILLLVAAILFTRTAVILIYNEAGIVLRIRVLGIPITLYPRKEKPEKKKKAKKKKIKAEKKIPEQTPEQKKPNLGDHLKNSVKELKLTDYIEILQTVLTDFIGKFIFEKLILHIAVGGDDAMKIAMTYGHLNALLYPVLGALAAADKLDRCDVQLTPDFASEEFRAEGHAVFSVRLYHAIGCVLKLLKKL